MDFSRREVMYVSDRYSPASYRKAALTTMDMKLMRWYISLVRKDFESQRRFTDILPKTLKYLEYLNGKSTFYF